MFRSGDGGEAERKERRDASLLRLRLLLLLVLLLLPMVLMLRALLLQGDQGEGHFSVSAAIYWRNGGRGGGLQKMSWGGKNTTITSVLVNLDQFNTYIHVFVIVLACHKGDKRG